MAHHRRRTMQTRAYRPQRRSSSSPSRIDARRVRIGRSPSPSDIDAAPRSPSLTLPISTAEDAMAAVVVAEPRFAAIQPRELDLIGQSAWWEARPASGVGAFVVTISVGWGDCQAGCIDEHAWTYAVTPDGGVRLLSEDGPPVPADSCRAVTRAGPASAGSRPPGPSARSRRSRRIRRARRDLWPAPGSSSSTRRARRSPRSTTDDAGAFSFDLEAGDYTIQADPVEGLMGTPAPVGITVATARSPRSSSRTTPASADGRRR